jgi:hypothetical protein
MSDADDRREVLDFLTEMADALRDGTMTVPEVEAAIAAKRAEIADRDPREPELGGQ